MEEGENEEDENGEELVEDDKEKTAAVEMEVKPNASGVEPEVFNALAPSRQALFAKLRCVAEANAGRGNGDDAKVATAKEDVALSGAAAATSDRASTSDVDHEAGRNMGTDADRGCDAAARDLSDVSQQLQQLTST